MHPNPDVVDQSVTVWLQQLGEGDQGAALKLWQRYGAALRRIVRRRFQSAVTAAADDEDIVQSVFRALWMGAVAKQFEQVGSRDELWWLLLTITRRKALNRRAYNSRRKRRPVAGRIEHNSAENGRNEFVGWACVDKNQPPPDLILTLAEERELLLERLPDDKLRSIALWKLDGYTNEEIAAKLNVTPRTIVRKLNLIRANWQQELGP